MRAPPSLVGKTRSPNAEPDCSNERVVVASVCGGKMGGGEMVIDSGRKEKSIFEDAGISTSLGKDGSCTSRVSTTVSRAAALAPEPLTPATG